MRAKGSDNSKVMTELQVVEYVGFESVKALTNHMIENHDITESHWHKLTSEAQLRLFLWEEYNMIFEEDEICISK